MARCRPTLRAEDVEALTLLMSPAADEFAIALDRCGWMIVQQPQFGDRRWFMNCPSDASPEWLTMMCPKSRLRRNHACGSSTAARTRQRVLSLKAKDAVVERSKLRS
jgi:hypothetical protein